MRLRRLVLLTFCFLSDSSSHETSILSLLRSPCALLISRLRLAKLDRRRQTTNETATMLASDLAMETNETVHAATEAVAEDAGCVTSQPDLGPNLAESNTEQHPDTSLTRRKTNDLKESRNVEDVSRTASGTRARHAPKRAV